MSDAPLPFSHLIPVAELPGRARRETTVSAAPEALAAVAAALGLPSLSSLTITATISPKGPKGWRVVGRVKAAAKQACVVTLEPVAAKVDEPVERVYLEGLEIPEEDEALEIDIDPEADDPPEPLGAGVDLGAIAVEALNLGLDPYPRAPGAAFESRVVSPPGAAPMTDEAVKPFAGLAKLKDAMERGD